MEATKNYVPISCCSPSVGIVHGIVCNDNTTDLPEEIENAHAYEIGCVSAFGSFVENHAVSLGGAGIAIAMIQVCTYAFKRFLILGSVICAFLF